MASTEDYPDDQANRALTALEADLEAPYFSAEEVASSAVWPAVDQLWNGDWRKESYPGLDFQFPRRAECEEGMTDIFLTAACEIDHPDDSEAGRKTSFLCSATIAVQVTATDALRDLIIGRAYESAVSAEDYTEDELVAKTSVSYTFSMDGEVFVCGAQEVVTADDAEVLWSSEYEGSDEYYDYRQKLHEEDLDRIGEALMMLTDSPDYGLVINALKHRPIEEPSGE